MDYIYMWNIYIYMYTSSMSCVCWPNNLMVTNPLTTFMIPKCHLANRVRPCNPIVYGAAAASLTPPQPVGYPYIAVLKLPSSSKLPLGFCGPRAQGPYGPGPSTRAQVRGPGIPFKK